MPTTPLIESRRLSLYHADYTELAAYLTERGEVIDMLCVDAPYSERTHKGHDDTLPGGRSAIPYKFWTPEDVHVFVQTWRPLTRGWLVSITDHNLWPAWQKAAEQAGLYAGFPPIPLSITGSRVRMQGDGPCAISYFLLVARPPELVKWGTIGRGAYYGKREKLALTGAKPLWAMREIVQDYSRPGQVVCDPLCGTGTVNVAALLEGRESIGGDGTMSTLLIAETRCEQMMRALDQKRARPTPEPDEPNHEPQEDHPDKPDSTSEGRSKRTDRCDHQEDDQD